MCCPSPWAKKVGPGAKATCAASACCSTAVASRVGGSVLTAIGLPELIAEDTDAYERIARDLACDPAAHTALREKLARNAATYPLFDTQRYARNLESAYREMWRRHEFGLAPDHIIVTEAR